jgi:hypothetical protein
MTRINVIPPQDLCDEHLKCELREILRVPFALIQMAHRGKGLDDVNVLPADAEYRLGDGHVRFFYDKLEFLYLRYKALRRETIYRGFLASDEWPHHIEFPNELWNDWEPTKEAILINLRRLTRKFQHKFRPTYSKSSSEKYDA